MRSDLSALAVAAALFCQPLQAGSSICATVVDPAGYPLSDTAVKVINLLEDRKRFAVLTGERGEACTENLPEGLYSVEASKAGFLNVRYHPVRVVFPHDVRLRFQLPLGEVAEGGLSAESDLTGTLLDRSEPAAGVTMCLFSSGQTIAAACTTTNDLGQYAMTVPSGVYWLEFKKAARSLARVKVDLSVSGTYRNRVSFPQQNGDRER